MISAITRVWARRWREWIFNRKKHLDLYCYGNVLRLYKTRWRLSCLRKFKISSRNSFLRLMKILWKISLSVSLKALEKFRNSRENSWRFFISFLLTRNGGRFHSNHFFLLSRRAPIAIIHHFFSLCGRKIHQSFTMFFGIFQGFPRAFFRCANIKSEIKKS